MTLDATEVPAQRPLFPFDVGEFLTTPEAFALAAEDGLSLPGALRVAAAGAKHEVKITQAFRTGDGVGWPEHDEGDGSIW